MSIQTTAKRIDIITRGTFPAPTSTPQRKLADCTVVVFKQASGGEDNWAESVTLALGSKARDVREVACEALHTFTEELQMRALGAAQCADVAVVVFYRHHAKEIDSFVVKLRAQNPEIKTVLVTADPDETKPGLFDLVVDKVRFTKDGFRDKIKTLVES